MRRSTLLLAFFAASTASAQGVQGDYVAKDFKFVSGESLPEVRLHYTILGTPRRDARGIVRNAVLVLHGTGGTGRGFLSPNCGGELFGPGKLLDTARYFIVLPDDIGHGGSSKPSNGLHAKFPHYDYDDMVHAEHLLLTEGLKVESPAPDHGHVDGVHARLDVGLHLSRRSPTAWFRWRAFRRRSRAGTG